TDLPSCPPPWHSITYINACKNNGSQQIRGCRINDQRSKALNIRGEDPKKDAVQAIKERHRTNHVIEEKKIGQFAQPEAAMCSRHPAPRHHHGEERQYLESSFQAQQSDKHPFLI